MRLARNHLLPPQTPHLMRPKYDAGTELKLSLRPASLCRSSVSAPGRPP